MEARKLDPFFKPMDADGRRRVRQVIRYLAAHWPTPFPVVLLLAPIATQADSTGYVERRETWRGRTGPLLLLRLDSRMTTAWALETLRHEWAHAATWPASARFERRQVRIDHPDHDPAWRGVYGSIEAAFYDGSAAEDSEEW